MPSFAGLTWVCDPVVQNCIGWAAVFAVLGLFASPIKDIWGKKGVYARKNTGNLASGLVYFSSFFNCLFWVLYALGDLPRLLQPLVINLIGASLHLSFLSCYWYFTEDKKESQYAFVAGAAVAAVSALVAYNQSSLTIFGTAAAFLNVVMYYSPLAAVGTVLKEKSVAKFPFLPLLMTLIGSSLWLSYGAYIFDWPCIIPNLLGITFGIVQIATYVYISKTYLEGKTITSELSDASPTPEDDTGATGGTVTVALATPPHKPACSATRRQHAQRLPHRQLQLVPSKRATVPLVKKVHQRSAGHTHLRRIVTAQSARNNAGMVLNSRAVSVF